MLEGRAELIAAVAVGLVGLVLAFLFLIEIEAGLSEIADWWHFAMQ